MADDSLKDPVAVRAIGINASSLPRGLNPAYEQYIISQVVDFTNVAGKANESGQGAYDAQVKNDEQDVQIDNHESRITANTNAISLIEVRLTTAEGKIVTLRSDVDYLLLEVISIESDMVSKSSASNQTIQSSGGSFLIGNIPSPTTDKLQVAGSENVSVSYKVSGLQVIGARVTGFSAMTGTARKTTLNADYSETGSATYSSAQMTQIFDLVKEARQKLKAHDDAMRTHGLID